MKLSIGENIARLRKQAGLTQERLASVVGVSAPAVSKWETGASYPDITILSPIARALKVNLDTLMDFTPRLTEAECATYAVEAGRILREEGGAAARAYIEETLHDYPENPRLQLQMAAVLTGSFLPDTPEYRLTRDMAKELLESVARGDEASLIPVAAHLLSSLCLTDGELNRAEAFLSLVPAPIIGAEILRACIHEKRGDIKAARKILQSQLLTSFNQMQTCLSKLAEAAYCKDLDTALRICEIHRRLSEILGYPYAMSEAIFAEVYQKAGDYERAAGYLNEMIKKVCDASAPFDDDLFGELFTDGKPMAHVFPVMRRNILEALQSGDEYANLRAYPATIEAIELLKKSLQDEKAEERRA